MKMLFASVLIFGLIGLVGCGPAEENGNYNNNVTNHTNHTNHTNRVNHGSDVILKNCSVGVKNTCINGSCTINIGAKSFHVRGNNVSVLCKGNRYKIMVDGVIKHEGDVSHRDLLFGNTGSLI